QAYHNLAMLHAHEQGDAAMACRLAEEALVHQQRALAADAGDLQFRRFARNHLDVLAESLLRLGRAPEARVHTLRALDLSAGLMKQTSSRGDIFAYARSLSNHAAAEAIAGDVPAALRELDKALDLGRQLVQAFPAIPAFREAQARDHRT